MIYIAYLSVLSLCVTTCYYPSLLILVIINKKKTLKQLEKELGLFTNQLLYSLKAGISPINFLSNYSQKSSPIQKSLQKFLIELNNGTPLVEACHSLAKAIAHNNYNYLFCALAIGLKSGASLSKILLKVKEIAQADLKLKRTIHTKTVSLQFQSTIIATLPLFLSVIMYFFHPHKIKIFFNSSEGIQVLSIALIIKSIGILLIYKLIQTPLKNNPSQDFLNFIELISMLMSSGKSLNSSILYLKKIFLFPKISNFILQYEKNLNSGKTFNESLDLIKHICSNQTFSSISFLFREHLTHGISIKRILDDFAKELREEISTKMLSEAERLPVKLIFPLIFLIAPASIILIIYPILFG